MVYDNSYTCWKHGHIAYVIFSLFPLFALYPLALWWTSSFKWTSGIILRCGSQCKGPALSFSPRSITLTYTAKFFLCGVTTMLIEVPRLLIALELLVFIFLLVQHVYYQPCLYNGGMGSTINNIRYNQFSTHSHIIDLGSSQVVYG